MKKLSYRPIWSWLFSFLIINPVTFNIEETYQVEGVVNIAKIIPFKNRQKLEKEKAVKVIREQEEVNWQLVEEREEEKERYLSQGEIEWLNEWVKDNEFDK